VEKPNLTICKCSAKTAIAERVISKKRKEKKNMAIDKIEYLRRLSFIKFLFDTGVEQSNKSDPLCNVAMLSFHDSIELFLQLACEHLFLAET
jgi:hypothetical protein